jgi:hypothetical protein
MYTLEFFGKTGRALDRAVAGTDRARAIFSAKRMFALCGELTTIAGVRVVDQNGTTIYKHAAR